MTQKLCHHFTMRINKRYFTSLKLSFGILVNISDSIINSDLSRLSVWSENNCRTINNAKIKAMSISHHQIEPSSNLILKDSVISFADNRNNLGFFINSKLSCVTHVNFTDSRIYGVLSKLWFSALFLTIKHCLYFC